MSGFVPVNNLDRAIMAMQKSKAATPDVYRRLCEGELWFAIQYHPELEEGGGFEFQNGDPVPFAMLDDGKGRTYVPLFSSGERFDESLERSQVPEKKFIAASMPAKQLLQILGHLKLHANVNMGCTTGSLMMPPDLMRDLASGKVFEPEKPTGETQEVALQIVDPVEFPTNFLQALFEKLQRHPEFRVAWLFRHKAESTPPSERLRYSIFVVMEPWKPALLHELNLVAGSAGGKDFDFDFMPTTAADTAAIKLLYDTGAPFYVAIDYQPPAAPAEE